MEWRKLTFPGGAASEAQGILCSQSLQKPHGPECRALITVAERPTALANSWIAAEFRSCACFCLFMESGISVLGLELLAAGAQESLATFTDLSVTCWEKLKWWNAYLKHWTQKTSKSTVCSVVRARTDGFSWSGLADHDWDVEGTFTATEVPVDWKDLEQSRLWSRGLSPGHGAWLIMPVYNLRFCL